jgi:predicted nucleic acid-binding protein
MILLDTNVVSEALRPRPSEAVAKWMNSTPATSLFLCAPVLAELRYGVERLPEGARRTALQTAVDRIRDEGFRDRILPFDIQAAEEYGRLVVVREQRGRPIDTMDAQIAAIALVNRLALATGNNTHFDHLGLELINPFEAAAPR